MHNHYQQDSSDYGYQVSNPTESEEAAREVGQAVLEAHSVVDPYWVARVVLHHMQPVIDAARAEAPKFVCKVRAAGLTDPPQDCDWPGCGCDPYADKVIEALDESTFSPEEVRKLIHASVEGCKPTQDDKASFEEILRRLRDDVDGGACLHRPDGGICYGCQVQSARELFCSKMQGARAEGRRERDCMVEPHSGESTKREMEIAREIWLGFAPFSDSTEELALAAVLSGYRRELKGDEIWNQNTSLHERAIKAEAALERVRAVTKAMVGNTLNWWADRIEEAIRG